ncbi:ABC-type transport system involved in cytochrome c biogenesis permease subunit [Caldalkalibacillus uzonensis]|uniref:ABC-type transport system involved in cytochrome c biogenesis permease subunit n=1 Tax=Caldalkalibacillus uzonensis TaxID=353224 RepID=A0ABU0CRY8_9BACI|nr:cytochrome c biogenesis protein CcsA [Caldalkalibacillus uzonensis]MDQ0339187.1 ABC-type transport system involved in cytochrome c biogenesis permease subunit [Caldalkalibacillus uzonensis]
MNETLISFSSTSLLTAFILYLVSTVFFVFTVTGRTKSAQEKQKIKQKWGRLGFALTTVGFILHAAYYIMRWIGQGHAPVSSMFEFMSFLAMMTVLGFIIIYNMYKTTTLGVFVLPLAVTLLGWASVFDTTPQPLIPALQSHWLKLHVSTVALGEGLFAVGFAAGLMYIIRTVDQNKSSWHTVTLEWCLASILMLVGFIALVITFSALDYEVQFNYINERGQEQVITYALPALAGPYQGEQLTPERMSPLIETPSWMQGRDAPRKFNTLVWSVLCGGVMYLLLRLLARKRLGAVIQPWLADLKPSMLDEISYRAIVIAFPIFTLGGLVFAMIWAEEAWGRFWGWDPKEVWALITWLFYAAYLHLRLTKGWEGLKSAWLAVLGFVIIMFNLVFVNLVISGLHSYVSG